MNKSTAILDPVPSARIRQLGGDALLRKIVDLFLDNAPRRIREAEAALRSRDGSALTLASHSLKSMAANLGLKELRAVASVLERLAEVGELSGCGEILPELSAAMERAKGGLDFPPEAPAPAIEVPDSRPDPESAGRRVAVVEDNPDNRLLMDLFLKDRYDVAAYATGPEALAGLRERKADVVLLDISLPEMDGVEVLRAIRSDAALRDLPVVAVTAHAMSGHRDQYLRAGFDDYVSKPSEEEVRLQTLERVLKPRAAKQGGTRVRAAGRPGVGEPESRRV